MGSKEMDKGEQRSGGERGRRRGPRKATEKSLTNAALFYLQRFASSSENLRRVLLRRVARSARHHGTDPAEGTALVDAIVARFEGTGLLDDQVYAEARARSLHRRGASTRMIRAGLRQKGLDDEVIARALAALAEEIEDPELAAAVALAQRRRLGPHRAAGQRDSHREKDLAALARAGFSYDIARRVIEAETVADLEALLSGEG